MRIRDLINVYSYLLSLLSHCSNVPHATPSSYSSYVAMDLFDAEFYDRKDALVIAEMQILKRLGFQTQVQLPFGELINYLKVLELSGNDEFIGRCWGYVNDMWVPSRAAHRADTLARLQTPAPALYSQSTLAVSAIYLTARTLEPPINLPLEPPWWTLFDATEQEILGILTPLLALYKDWQKQPGDEQTGSIWSRGKALPIDKRGVRELCGDTEGSMK